MLPAMLPALRSESTITARPKRASAIAAMVTRVSRSPKKMRARMTAINGTIDERNAAFAPVVVLSA